MKIRKIGEFMEEEKSELQSFGDLDEEKNTKINSNNKRAASNQTVVSITDDNDSKDRTNNDDSVKQEQLSNSITAEQLKRILNRYRSKLPSAIINELYNSLSTMDLTEDEAVSIINEVYSKYTGGSKEELEEIMLKIQKNDVMLRSISEKIEKLLDVFTKNKNTESESMSPIDNDLQSKTKESEVKQTLENKEIKNAIMIEPILNDSNFKNTNKEVVAKTKLQDMNLNMQNIQDSSSYNAASQEPLLTYIKKDPFSMAVLMRWIEFMLKKVGNDKLSDLLDYYLDIGWISEEVVLQVLTYAKGMEVHVEKGARRRLTPEDHFKTLLFIEKMRGTPIDRLTLTKMERELSLLTKKSEDYDDVYGI